MVCPRCGNQISNNASVCTYCRYDLDCDFKESTEESKDVSVLPRKKNKMGIVVCMLMICFICILLKYIIPSLQDKSNDIVETQTPKARIEIRIIDQAGNEISEAAVGVIDPETGEELANTLCDERGNVSFAMPAKTYEFYAEKEGYYRASTIIKMKSSEIANEYSTVITLTILPSQLSVYVIDATSREPINHAKVTLCSLTGRKINSASLDGEPCITMIDIKNGDYIIQAAADGYYSREIKYTFEDNDRIYICMVPDTLMAEDNEVLFLLEWEGEHDLDLCLYNAYEDRYVTAGNYPKDDSGNFVFSNNGVVEGYEVFYLRNKKKKNSQVLYVIDSNAAEANTLSTMEKDGVTLTVYDRLSGNISVYNAQIENNEPVWKVFDCNGGKLNYLDKYYKADELDWVMQVY